LPSSDIFRTGEGGYSDADIRTFCCKNKHRIFQNLIVRPNAQGGGIMPVLTFFWTREGQFFMILCRRPLWTASEQKSKVKHKLYCYRPTNSYTIDSLYRVCIKRLLLNHDHLWLLNLMAVLVLWVLLGTIYCIVYIFFQSLLISVLPG